MERLTLRQKIFQKYWYFRLFYQRAHNYMSMPIDLFQFYALATVYLKLVLGVQNNLKIGLAFGFLFIVFILIGYIDVKHHINREEISWNNQFNPEITHLIRKAGGRVRK